jgi:hypothetical protein
MVWVGIAELSLNVDFEFIIAFRGFREAKAQRSA